MTHSQSALSELADALIGTDATLTTSIAEILGTALQELIEAEVSAKIGADHGERTPTRSNLRNGHRPKLLSTPAGDVEVGIPKLRKGSFFPELLEPRRRIDKALWAVITRDWITGTSTRKVDDLVKALGVDSGVSKSTVSRICKLIDDDVAILRGRRLDHQPFPYIWLDPTYVHVREHGQVVSKAVVIATGGSGWQRCRVHAKRNLLAVANHIQRQLISALISTIFAQPDGEAARAQLRTDCQHLQTVVPKVAERLEAMRTTCSPTRRSRPCTGQGSGPTTRYRLTGYQGSGPVVVPPGGRWVGAHCR